MSKVIEVKYKEELHYVLVDDDFTTTGTIRKKDGYFTVNKNNKKIYLHRYILGVTDKGLTVDHINGDPTDNRKSNLRVCTMQENLQNRRCKGFSYNTNAKKYQARIRKDGKLKHLGYYRTSEEAQQVYRKAHAEAFGEFSPYYKYDSGITKEEN